MKPHDSTRLKTAKRKQESFELHQQILSLTCFFYSGSSDKIEQRSRWQDTSQIQSKFTLNSLLQLASNQNSTKTSKNSTKTRRNSLNTVKVSQNFYLFAQKQQFSSTIPPTKPQLPLPKFSAKTISLPKPRSSTHRKLQFPRSQEIDMKIAYPQKARSCCSRSNFWVYPFCLRFALS
jgi:hypothetical protein